MSLTYDNETKTELLMSEITDPVMPHIWQAHITSHCTTSYDKEANSLSYVLETGNEKLFSTATRNTWSWGFTDGTENFTGENSMPDFGDSHQVLQEMSELLIEMAQTQLIMNYPVVETNEDE